MIYKNYYEYSSRPFRASAVYYASDKTSRYSFSWTPPAGAAESIYSDMLAQTHLLIAGATGSGKSVVINGIIYTAMLQSPESCKFVLIDPKRVELIEYAQLPHTIGYASEYNDIIEQLNQAVDEMERRYTAMQAAKIKKSNESHIYIFIDEFADLMTTAKKETLTPLCRLAQLGRAANIHLIIATQRPTRDIINGQIKVNIDSRLALRCPNAQDSRNIIETKGAEILPRFGFGLYTTPERFKPSRITIPMISDSDIRKRVEFWQCQSANIKVK